VADIYPSDEGILRDYRKLSQEYKNKAGKYMKNLLRVQRAEKGIEQEVKEKCPDETPTHQAIEPKKVRCSFCGKWQDQVQRIIAGPCAYICNECVGLCNEILDEVLAEEAAAGEGEPHAKEEKETE